MKKSVFAVAVAVLVGGCASAKPASYADKKSETLRSLMDHTREIQTHWGVTSRLTALQSGHSKQVIDLNRLSPSLKRVYQFPGGYEGKLSTVVKQLTLLSGFDYLTPSGKKPVGDIPVIFLNDYRTVGEFIWGAGEQAGTRATVHVDMINSAVQISYAGF